MSRLTRPNDDATRSSGGHEAGRPAVLPAAEAVAETGAMTRESTRRSAHLQGAFGGDRFGRLAERFARFFGTPGFIIGQTAMVAVWIALNGAAVGFSWDPYPFILLNLAFSTQAAYAAPLILLAQTRQTDRDKVRSDAVDAHHDKAAALQERLLDENTRLTCEIERLTERIFASMTADSSSRRPSE